MSVEIERVETEKQLQEFLKVPWDVYRHDPNWVPWLYFERLEFFDKSKNPFFEHAEADYFIARREGKAVGTIAAILNHSHNEVQKDNAAHFGAFELLDDPEAANLLLETACNWAKERGVDRILGPATFSSNDEWGMLIDGFDSPPVVMMTYNPRYYLGFMEQNGFDKAMDLWAWRGDIQQIYEDTPEKLVRVVDKVRDRYNLTVRTVNMKDWDAEVDRALTVYNDAWEENWGFIPFTDSEVRHLAAGLKPVVDPRILFMAEREKEIVGFALNLPNLNEPLRRARPGPSVIGSYIGAARMLLGSKWGKLKWVRVWGLGVRQQYRNRGVDALLYYETLQACHKLGYQLAEASWLLETNDKMNQIMRTLGLDVYKTYRIYQKNL